MRSTGKRHAFLYRYDVGFDDAGRILGLDLTLASRCAFRPTCPADQRPCRVPRRQRLLGCPTSRSIRTVPDEHRLGHGVPRLRRAAGMFAIEAVIEAIAAHLGVDPLEVRAQTSTHERSHTSRRSR